MTGSLKFKKVQNYILNGLLKEAEAELAKIQADTKVEKRIWEHQQAVIESRRGQLEKARDRMIKARIDFGDNVSMTRDLAVCHYQLNEMLEFRATLDRLERAVIECESQLSTRSLVMCETTLGKFLEEEGRLAPALIYYDRALLRVNEPLHRIRILLQKARWHALYEPTQNLSSYYRELISVPTQSLSQDLKIEFEHSLMLVELRLIGADHAWQRYTRLDPSVPEIERRLLVFDFLEGALIHDFTVRPEVLDVLRDLKDLDPFETYLRKLVLEHRSADQKIQDLNLLATQLPWASYLRLLCLTANLEVQTAAKQELNRKIQLIISSLDSKSQSLWIARIKHALQTPEVRIEFSARSRSLIVQGKTIDLSKKKMGQQLLQVLLKKPALTVDQAIEHLWQSSFSPEHYHRLRMGIHRLNTLIHELSGQGKIIEVDSQEVRLRPEVRLKAVDDINDSPLTLN